MDYYTGIGSRNAPRDVLDTLYKIARFFRKHKWILRSGGARGCDTSAERGAEGLSEIFIPYRAFSRNPRHIVPNRDRALHKKAWRLVERYHPEAARLNQIVRMLHCRNMFQVLGRDLETPSRFVVYWAPESESGVVQGGTRMAVYCARAHGIPTFNIEHQLNEFRDFTRQLISTSKED